jgi:diguanylate cyclase (GGDEF)-like protein/PAS domain S-box-containing protein
LKSIVPPPSAHDANAAHVAQPHGLLARANAWLRSHWDDASASPLDREAYKRQQLSASVRAVPSAMASNFVVLGLLVAILHDLTTPQNLYLYCLVAALVFLAHYYGAWLYRRAATPNLTSYTRALQVGAIAISLLYALGPLSLFPSANGSVRLLLACLSVGIISSGSFAYAFLPQVAIPWISTFSLGAAIALYRTGDPTLSAVSLIVLWFGFAFIGNVLSTSKIFLSGLRAASEVERQKHVVGLLLNDFEASASDWLWETDKDGRLQHVSARLAEATGQSPTALIGVSFADLIAGPFKRASREEHEAILALQESLAGQSPFRNVAVPVLNEGTTWWSLAGKPLVDKHGKFSGFRGVGSDITGARSRELEMHRLANFDTLTLIANRHRFQNALDDHFKEGAAAPCSLFLIDLDNFKTINDSLGHGVGDLLLKSVAERLVRALGEGSLIARLGGDEFAVLVAQEFDREAALAHGAKIHAALEDEVVLEGQRVEARASIGFASAPTHGTSAVDLLKASDVALFAAKAAGRHVLRVYDATMDRAARTRNDLAKSMKSGLKEGQFSIHYQPQVGAKDGVLVGFEALLRWKHPVHGSIAPNDFIPIAEESGFIIVLGAWVLREACRAAALWPEHLYVAVNLSAIQFASADLLQTVSNALTETGLAPHRLELELTESALVADQTKARAILVALRERKVKVAIDDFGTGFSSLSYLRHLPLDKLKIDRSFVNMLDPQADNPATRAIVQAIIDMAGALSLETTAEGVETEDQRNVLRSMGCSQIQGWLTGKPMDENSTRASLSHMRAVTIPVAPRALE